MFILEMFELLWVLSVFWLQRSSWSAGINVQAHCAQTVQVPTQPSNSLQAFWQHGSVLEYRPWPISVMTVLQVEWANVPRCQRVNATCSLPLVCASCLQRDRQEIMWNKPRWHVTMFRLEKCQPISYHFHSRISYSCMCYKVITC